MVFQPLELQIGFGVILSDTTVDHETAVKVIIVWALGLGKGKLLHKLGISKQGIKEISSIKSRLGMQHNGLVGASLIENHLVRKIDFEIDLASS